MRIDHPIKCGLLSRSVISLIVGTTMLSFIRTHAVLVSYMLVIKFFYTGVPLAPSNVAIGGILNSTGSELTVNLTWSNSRCVVVYCVEVTATNKTSITNTTSQYIVLPLQIGVVYSFRVRGADSINRSGEWSDSLVYTPSK